MEPAMYLRPKMGYARITIHLADGSKRTGVRRFGEPMILPDIRMHALQLSAEVLGRAAIEEVTVEEVPATDPAVIALILRDERHNKPIPRSDGTHPFVKQQGRKPRH